MADGNIAAMRAALEAVREAFDSNDFGAMGDHPRSDVLDMVDAVRRKIEAALAAPPRNCDRFDDYQDAVEAWQNEERCLGRRKDGGTCKNDPLASALAPLCFARWAFARAERGVE